MNSKVPYLWNGNYHPWSTTTLSPPFLPFYSLFLYCLLWLICSSRALFLIWVWDRTRPRHIQYKPIIFSHLTPMDKLTQLRLTTRSYILLPVPHNFFDRQIKKTKIKFTAIYMRWRLAFLYHHILEMVTCFFISPYLFFIRGRTRKSSTELKNYIRALSQIAKGWRVLIWVELLWARLPQHGPQTQTEKRTSNLVK